MTMITPSYLGETIEYSSLHACRSTLEDPTSPLPIGPSRADDVDIVPPRGQALGEVRQMLGRRRMVWPVILIDEKKPPGGDRGRRVDPVRPASCVSLETSGRILRGHSFGRRGRDPHRRFRLVRAGPDPPPGRHHFVSAWALLARYQAMVLASPSFSEVGGDQPSSTRFIRVTSSTLKAAPSGLSVFQASLPL